MFSEWQPFYQLTGSAAGALIGLLFLVATLSGRLTQPRSMAGQNLFTTPTVFHLALVLVISALALAPGSDTSSASLVMTGCSLYGFIYAAVIAIKMTRIARPTHWSDFWFYGAAPATINAALILSTAAAWWGVSHAAYAVGLALLVLLMVTIRNAWDLITWLAPRRSETPENLP